MVEVPPTAATTPDGAVSDELHQRLAAQEILPEHQVLALGSVDAEGLAESQRRSQVDVVGNVDARHVMGLQSSGTFRSPPLARGWAGQTGHLSCRAGQPRWGPHP